MIEYTKDELFDKLMDTIKASDGPELAYYHKVILQSNITSEDAHYQHDEIVEEIEAELSISTVEELQDMATFFGVIAPEDEQFN